MMFKKLLICLTVLMQVLVSVPWVPALAAELTDYHQILTDNCSVRYSAGQNIAPYAKAYMYGSKFLYASTPLNSNTTSYNQNANWPECAIDGDYTTYAQMSQTGSWTYILDFKKVCTISRIAVTFRENNCPVDYDILISTEEKPSMEKDGKNAIRAWVSALDLLFNEKNNTRSGTHEFQFQPQMARYVVIRDNVAQTKEKQMAIAEVEVNHVAEFYRKESDGQLTALSRLEPGEIVSVSGEIGGYLQSVLYDKGGKRFKQYNYKKIRDNNTELSTLIEEEQSGEDYTKTSLSEICFVSADDFTVSVNPYSVALTDRPGYYFNRENQTYGQKKDVYSADLAIDGGLLSYARAAQDSYALCITFSEEKPIGAVDIMFSENGVPMEAEIYAETSDDLKLVSANVGKRNEFKTVNAQRIFICCRVGSMHISEVSVYDKLPEYELRSFVWGNEMTSLGGVKSLK